MIKIIARILTSVIKLLEAIIFLPDLLVRCLVFVGTLLWAGVISSSVVFVLPEFWTLCLMEVCRSLTRELISFRLKVLIQVGSELRIVLDRLSFVFLNLELSDRSVGLGERDIWGWEDFLETVYLIDGCRVVVVENIVNFGFALLVTEYLLL